MNQIYASRTIATKLDKLKQGDAASVPGIGIAPVKLVSRTVCEHGLSQGESDMELVGLAKLLGSGAIVTGFRSDCSGMG